MSPKRILAGIVDLRKPVSTKRKVLAGVVDLDGTRGDLVIEQVGRGLELVRESPDGTRRVASLGLEREELHKLGELVDLALVALEQPVGARSKGPAIVRIPGEEACP